MSYYDKNGYLHTELCREGYKCLWCLDREREQKVRTELQLAKQELLLDFCMWLQTTGRAAIEPFNAKGAFDRDEAIEKLVEEYTNAMLRLD